jgi:putative hydrolase of the HAD superfamily
MKKDFKVIGFDADDTMWENEPYYRETETVFYGLLSEYIDAEACAKELYQVEMKNLDLYGYGAKGFMLSMAETALKVSGNKLPGSIVGRIIELGHELLDKPVVLINGIEEVLRKLKDNGYRLIIATKGDLLDQQRKLAKSRLEPFFHHIEVMSDKKESDYRRLISHLDIEPGDFLMIGNSMRSDILPVLAIGGHAIHVPFHTTWAHEEADIDHEPAEYHKVEEVSEVLALLEIL